MLVSDLVRTMEAFAPLRYAEPWDNVGLLVGSPDQRVEGPVLLAIDLTEEVLDEAVEARASAVVAYHPPIWEPLKRITSADTKQRVILGAVRAGLAVYSPHTALDAAPGGMADWLCEGLSCGSDGKVAGDCRAIGPITVRDENQEVKIVTFVPAEHAERVRGALASSGAGLIGRYSACSFSVPGRGTFLGDRESRPSIGVAERLETVDELRLEMVCSKAALPLAVEALRQFHPYEEPAIDIYELMPKPQRAIGAGRRLVLDQPATIAELADRLKAFLGVSVVKVAPAGPEDRPVTRLGVCPGSGSALAPAAAANGCEVYISGEMDHHEVMAVLHRGAGKRGTAESNGMGVILAGHSNTERGYLPRLASRLSRELAGLDARPSARDRSPFTTR